MTNDEQEERQSPDSGERADLLQALQQQRHFLRHTTRDLTDEQAAMRTTVSALCLGGIVKHVTRVERNWARFAVEGGGHMAFDPESMAAHAESFEMQEGDTLAGLLEAYEQVAASTDELVATHPDLDASHALPEAPWFPPGARWSARRAFLMILAETAQHAGHADIIREALDGAKSMG
jgi:hypothetical protein